MFTRSTRRLTKLAVSFGLLTFVCSQLILIPVVLSSVGGSQPEASPQFSHARAYQGSNWPPAKRPIPFRGNPDGSFNGAPIYLKQEDNIESHVHCVGDNYERDGWKHRSCLYRFICFNTLSNDFVLFQSKTEAKLADLVERKPFIKLSDAASRENTTVSIGGINLKWGAAPGQGIDRLEWQPKILPVREKLKYYMLPEEIVWAPLHSLNGANPGHLVWDDFLPVYTLLDMFDLLDHHPLLLRYVLQDGGRGLWAGCDVREEREKECDQMLHKFIPMMWGPDPVLRYTSSMKSKLVRSDESVHLVCAKHGVAGIGGINDHGTSKAHGWAPEDYKEVHNHGRGGDLFRFRNYVMRNMGYPIETLHVVKPTGPHRIIFSLGSSSIKIRDVDFASQIRKIKEEVPNVSVEALQFSKMTLREQLDAASSASIMVSVCGGAAVTGMFLPKGASLVLYYVENGGVKDNRRTHTPALLDFDLFNNLSHLRVQWMPLRTRNTDFDTNVLVELVKQEIAMIESGTV